jgi:DNA processing protein
MTDDFSLALTFLDTLLLVGLSDRLRQDDPELVDLAAPFIAEARAARLAAEADAIHFVSWRAPQYPQLLLELPDMPPGLWYRGRIESLQQPRAVAIVGSRAGSPVAIQTATMLARGLAARGVVIVSGLARGVDSAAHRGALAGGGITVGVLGSGHSRLYPAEHRSLAGEISGTGLVVSEYPPDMPALPFHFPRRNRIISGLSRAVIVIEAAEQSGSLITAACALEQGKDVMAVPGNVLSGRNRGGHALIRDGATIVESVEDILEQLGWSEAAPSGAGGVSGCDERSSADELLAKLQAGMPYALDEIAALAHLDATTLLARLTALELAGRLKRVEGGRFVRAV